MNFKLLKFKTKIIGAIVLTSFLLMISVVITVYFYLDHELINSKLAEIQKLNIEQVHESNQIFENEKIFAKMLATRTRTKEYLLEPTEAKRIELLGIFSDYAKEDEKYLSLYLLDKSGNAVMSTDPTFVGKDYSFRDYFKKGILGEPAVDILLGKTSNQFGYYFSYPIFDDSKNVIGVFVSKINNKAIDLSLKESQLSIDSNVMLTDQYGVVIFSSKEDRFLKSMGELNKEEEIAISQSEKFLNKDILPLQYDIVQEIIREKVISKTIKINDKEDGETKIMNINKVGNSPFYLVSETGIESIESTILFVIYILIGLIVLGIFFSGFFMYRLILISLKPLMALKLFSQSISSGDFSKRINIETKDEFGDLAKVFNTMAEDLDDLYKNLDKKVNDKTKEIETKSIELEEQKNAILNILDDVELQKINAERLSNDLEKFKLAVDNASDQVVITDPEGIVIYGNNAVEKITGYKKEEALGTKAGVLWKTPMPNSYYEELWDTIKNKKEVFFSEIKNKRKNGEFYIANISISPVLNENNDILYYVAIEHDITKEKDIDKAKTEFVSLASHQLRTPLSSINWYTEMLLAGDAGEINDEQKKYLTEVATGNQRMVDLVNSLLNVSRLDLGTFIIEPELIEVVDTSKSIIKELSHLIKEKDLKIEEKYDDLPPYNADRKLFRIIFQNLISNAVKYTPNGKEIIISIEMKNSGDIFGHKDLKEDSLVIFIKDTGIGIPEGQKEKIFSKMFRADNARESETEGTGLGLYIIKSIIDISGGEIWFESKENEGTTFYISLPKDGMRKKDGVKKLD